MHANEIATAVDSVMHECLYDEDKYSKVPPEAIVSPGIVTTYAFNPTQLHRPEVVSRLRMILAELPRQFFRGEGDGWSFLNLPTTKDGKQWGEHMTAEALFCLAQALDMARCLVPREFWSALPGGLPYVLFSMQQDLNHDVKAKVELE